MPPGDYGKGRVGFSLFPAPSASDCDGSRQKVCAIEDTLSRCKLNSSVYDRLRKESRGGAHQEDMAASQVKDESWVRSCACLSSWYDWLKNQQPLFFSLMFLDSEVVLMYLFPFVFMIVKGRSLCTVLLSFFPGPSLHYLYLSCTRSAVAAFS